MPDTVDVVVIGGGIIGAAVSWRLLAHGVGVALVDPAPGAAATATAAGMLAPVTELHYGEEALLALNIASAERYPVLVEELQDETGQDVGYARTGTLVAAWDGADMRALRDLLELQQSLGLSAKMLTATELREIEPAMAAGLPGGILAEDDHSIDPRRLHAALMTAAAGRGLRVHAARVVQLSEDAPGVKLDDGSSLSAAHVVVASGAWSASLMPSLPVRPVKGQTLRLRTALPVLSRVLRGSVRGNPVYLVPRRDGEVVVGATSEEAGFDLRARAGAVHDLLRDAQAVLPAITEMELVEVSTGLRPATPDNAPLIGTTDYPAVIAATGHYRNGILLAPITADAVAAAIVTGEVLPEVEPFDPQRFAVSRMTR